MLIGLYCTDCIAVVVGFWAGLWSSSLFSNYSFCPFRNLGASHLSGAKLFCVLAGVTMSISKWAKNVLCAWPRWIHSLLRGGKWRTPNATENVTKDVSSIMSQEKKMDVVSCSRDYKDPPQKLGASKCFLPKSLPAAVYTGVKTSYSCHEVLRTSWNVDKIANLNWATPWRRMRGLMGLIPNRKQSALALCGGNRACDCI